MPKDKFESLVKQDLALLIVGSILFVVTFTNLLGVNGFLTFFVGCGFTLFSTLDIARLVMKVKPEEFIE